MKRSIYICLALMLAGFASASPTSAQPASFDVPVGGIVGGGGNSTGGTFGVRGAVILTGGASTGGAFAVNGGLTAALTTGVAAIFAGNAVDTVPAALRQLKVAYAGGTGVATGKLYYRFGGQVSYASLDMSPGTGDTLMVNVPANLFNPRGLEYYFVVTRGAASASAGSALTPYVFVTTFPVGAPAQRPTALPDQSYRIVSVPVDIAGPNTVSAVFGDDLGAKDIKQWRLFHYSPVTKTNVEFPSAANVTPVRAYWLIVRGTGRGYDTPGTSRRPNRNEAGVDYFEVPLDSGWNQLANPLPFAVSWTEMRFDTSGVVTTASTAFMDDSAYSYTGAGYATVTTIPAWGGVFVNMKRPGVKAMFRYHEAGATATREQEPQNRPQVSASNWDVEVRLAANGHDDVGNFLGVRSDAAVGDDPYDYAEPPVAPEGAQVAFRLPDEAAGLKRSDFRPAFTDGATWELVLPQTLDRTLTVHGLDQIPAGMTATLLLDVGTVVKLGEATEVQLPNDVKSAKLVIGTNGYAAGSETALLPQTFALHQNFPNPFNPDTRIRFALPVESKLRINVFNVLGQKVRTLADGTYPAGTHDLIWDGRGDRGEDVGSGVYFYRMSSDQFTQTRRMLLIK